MKVVKIFILLFLFGQNIDVFAQSCNCKEYIYLNEPEANAVLKFEIGAPVLLTEKLGSNGGTQGIHHWYPGLGTSMISSPHGIASDLNGNLYIASTTVAGSSVSKLNCDGVRDQVYNLNVEPVLNMFSIGNTLFKTTILGPEAHDLCTNNEIGFACLAHSDGNQFTGNPLLPQQTWGLSYNEVTERTYLTSFHSSYRYLWVLTKNELINGVNSTTETCKQPLLERGSFTQTFANITVGDKWLPNDVQEMYGVTSDNSGNIYIVTWRSGPNYWQNVIILKYNALGEYQAQSVVNSRIVATHGLVWSETNRLYLANRTDDLTVDCISVLDANNLSYIGTGAPNPGLPANNAAKAIGILKECCPVNLPSTFQREVCGAIGSKFYLNQEAFDDCDGVVCGSSWSPMGTLTNMTFDACDNSVVVNGPGCGTFLLNIGAVTSTGCGAQTSTFTICYTVPSATITPSQGTCTGATANNDAVINITAATNANQAGISTGATYTGPAYNGVGTVAITGGIASFTSLMHNTQYTLRIFNGSNDCFVDYTVTTPTVTCCALAVTCTPQPQTNCTPINGSASVSVSGAIGTVTYLWSSGEMTSSITNKAAGTYTVTVTDVGVAGCTRTCQAVILNQSNAPTCSITVNTQPNCANLSGGSITVVPSPAGTYTYAWSDNGAATATRTGLMGGTYTVTVTNTTSNCTGVCNVTLTTPTNCCNIAAIAPQNLECYDNGTPNKISDNRIRFTANVTNTNALLTAYNVTINGGTTITPNTNVPYGVTQFLLGPGTAGGGATFTVTVTDSATPGCTQTFQVVDPGNCNNTTPCPTPKCGTATIQVNGN